MNTIRSKYGSPGQGRIAAAMMKSVADAKNGWLARWPSHWLAGASARPVRRVRRPATEIIAHVVAKVAGFDPVQRRARDRAGEQRPERHGAARGPGDEPPPQQPAQRRARRHH